MHVPNKEVIQTVRTGRPTDNPKPNRLQVMLSDSEVEKLEFCHKKTNLSKGEIVRQGIVCSHALKGVFSFEEKKFI